MLGLIGGLLYWALGSGDEPSESDDSAMEPLQRRYARGEIDEAEFQRRRERLVKNQENGSVETPFFRCVFD
ncbi:SHOCT domain-containing protein [Halosolutus halophilus]|uniref:SHOCT domain-containing protein n=1 Tax=Halosolutus halophilus TaxID=1552990 RepID=UPI002A59AEF9|nr:SHOCT domain-containing protein [Halosolutus halophilus]